MFLLSSFCSGKEPKPTDVAPPQHFSSTKTKHVNIAPFGTCICFCDDGEGGLAAIQAQHKIANLETMPHPSALETRMILLGGHQLCVSPERSQSTSTKSPVWHLCVFVTRAKFVRLFRLRTRSPTWNGCLIVTTFWGEWKHRKQGNNARPNVLPTNQHGHENCCSLHRAHNVGSNTPQGQALGANGYDVRSATFCLRDDFKVTCSQPADFKSVPKRLIPTDTTQLAVPQGGD
jgi:hypothetical protein